MTPLYWSLLWLAGALVAAEVIRAADRRGYIEPHVTARDINLWCIFWPILLAQCILGFIGALFVAIVVKR